MRVSRRGNALSDVQVCILNLVESWVYSMGGSEGDDADKDIDGFYEFTG